jgi:hypothetical protein
MPQREYTVADLDAGRIPGLTRKATPRRQPEHKRVRADVVQGCGWIRIVAPVETTHETNRKDHRFVKARRVKGQRKDLATMFLVAGPCPVPGPWVVKIVRIAPRRLELGDNLPTASKAIRDPTAAWLGCDDTERDPVTWEYDQRRGGVREYGVEITVETQGMGVSDGC